MKADLAIRLSILEFWNRTYMSSDDFETNQKNDEIVSVKINQSHLMDLIIGIIIAVGVAAFFAGMSYSSSLNSESDFTTRS